MSEKPSIYLSVILLFLLSATQIPAQSPRKILREANQLIDVELFNEAINLLQPLVQKNHPEATLLTGYSFLANDEKTDSAIIMLKKAAELHPLKQNSNRATIESYFYLAQALRLSGQTEEALETLQNLKKHTSNADVADDIEREINYCENYKKHQQNPVEMKVEHLGKILNSPYEDHSPIVLYDESTIYFTSTRPTDSINQANQFFENIFVSYWRKGQWTEPKLLKIPGYAEANRATVGVTPDGQGLIIFQNDRYSGALYITRRTFDGWTVPEPLPAPINSGFNETHASFSPDGNTVFFSSERPGGAGGKDIYFSNKLPDGTWGKPINAGENINSSFEEESPFMHPDGKTLYFSSSGRNSMGGYDIFKSVKSDTWEWSKAENLGYPINTPNDDLFYIPTPNGQRVYYSSRRQGGMGQTDLYLLHFPKDHERSIAVVSTHVFKTENQQS
jgi:tetratricopeptide (TPR) repeat protein